MRAGPRAWSCCRPWILVVAGACAGAGVRATESVGGPYSLETHVIANGGGLATGGAVVLEGSIGQPDASAVQTGGAYTLTGGFQRPASTPGDSVFGDGFD